MAKSEKVDLSTLGTDELKTMRAAIDAILDGPASEADGLDDAVEALKAAREKFAEVGRRAMNKFFREFMESHPEVASLRWQQYTPYFNDGDECVFRVREPSVKLAGGPEPTDDPDDDDEEYASAWDLGYNAKQKGTPKPKLLIADLESLFHRMDQAEDAMKATFGDHVRVTVGRDAEAVVEEYSHD